MFQEYKGGGIRPVTGVIEAGANIANIYQQGFSKLGEGLAKGIKTYNDNSAKSEMANQKIQSLSQDVANKIAMYSQDPEIAQSGVLEGLMQTAATLQDAPTKGLNQRIGLVHEAETRLAGFGNQLQEWSFLRGRAIERGISDALNQYAGKVKSTEAVNLDDPNFNINPNESIVQQKDRVMKYYGEIKKVNPKVQFNDQEFWQRWLAKAEQTTAKAQDIDPRIISAQLEAINAEKGITAQNRAAEGNLPEGAFQEGGMMYQDKGGVYDYQGTPMQNTLKDYEASMQKPSEAPARQEKQYKSDVADALEFLGINKTKETETKDYGALTSTGGINKHLVAENKKGEMTLNKNWQNLKTSVPVGDTYRYIRNDANQLGTWDEQAYQEAKQADELLERNVSYYQRKAPNENAFWESLIKNNKIANSVSASKDKRIESFAKGDFGENGIPTEALKLAERLGFQRSDYGIGYKGFGEMLPFGTGAVLAPAGYGEATNELPSALRDFFTRVKEGKFDPKTGKVDTGRPADAGKNDFIKPARTQTVEAMKPIWEQKGKTGEVSSSANPAAKKASTIPQVPSIGLGDVVVGTYDDERNLSVTERKSKVQDFLTQRFGAIDPTDPTGKRKIPVQGFEQFFQKAVPESEIQEYTTPSGIRLMRMNGKWEQMKMPEQKSLQDIRKEMIGVYGQQGRDGRLVPTEFLPNSGIYLGGLYRGGDAEEKEYKTEMIRLTDARRGVKVLQEINDRVGEFADFKASGRAKVEVMNLKAALRTDIIGVGTVSNFEQALIDEVIKDPTSFFSMEVRDRAILLALAERVDRRIRNLSAAGGLTVQIRDSNEEANKYDSLRQRYLKEKYGI